MRVVISVAGRFHAFQLAEQLQMTGSLEKLFATTPLRDTDRLSEVIYSGSSVLNLIDFLERVCHFSRLRFLASLLSWLKIELFDSWVAKKLRQTDFDIFVGWNGHCLKSLRAAKKKGAVTVVERGSSHPKYTEKVLGDEYRKLKIEWTMLGDYFSKTVFSNSLKEYDICDYVAVPSTFAENSFTFHDYPKNKLIVVPYGVDLSLFKQKLKRDDVFRVIYCGSVSIQKGIHYLLQAFYELNLSNSELILIGHVDNAIKPHLKKYARDNICSVGPKFQKELYKYYSKGCVFVFPSLNDGFGMVLLEAMACGLPVIGTTNSGAKDVVTEGDDGFIIPIRDIVKLKEKITILYDTPKLLSKMSARARRKAEQFTWDEYGDKINKEYSKILKRNNLTTTVLK